MRNTLIKLATVTTLAQPVAGCVVPPQECEPAELAQIARILDEVKADLEEATQIFAEGTEARPAEKDLLDRAFSQRIEAAQPPREYRSPIMEFDGRRAQAASNLKIVGDKLVFVVADTSTNTEPLTNASAIEIIGGRTDDGQYRRVYRIFPPKPEGEHRDVITGTEVAVQNDLIFELGSGGLEPVGYCGDEGKHLEILDAITHDADEALIQNQ
ncbi:hypothetical protein COV82_01400 [Candidatus Peregrinibacteria bacterium CG11_big_fil_rev_8_21_14_0_20_46_8]|nr:MAG: hypothetical protein COV82_01400 [Candidatus Peregrinibacteria bacterium CG11_big_fil_rev_8_21_14_0_20_46_8]